MTRRLFEEFPEEPAFSARVEDCRAGEDGTWAVTLDQTAFYPTSGGQPHDVGTLGGLRVLDVVEVGELVLHTLDGPLPPGARVAGEVDWPRRTDHRQQHTGQHILSRALEEQGARTIGFHLGQERCTIDLDRPLREELLDRGEARANAVVMENRPIEAGWHDRPPEGLRGKVPPEGPLRLVEIRDFDVNPCCGTHCRRTGDVGLIKILRWEKWKDGLRVEFVCGTRAYREVSRRHRALREAALALTTEELQVPERVEALSEERKSLRSALDKAQRRWLDLQCRRWLESREPLIVAELEAGMEPHLSRTALRLVEDGAPVALVVCPDGESARLALASGREELSAGTILRSVLSDHGGRGGGKDALAQGAAPLASLDSISRAVRKAAEDSHGTTHS